MENTERLNKIGFELLNELERLESEQKKSRLVRAGFDSKARYHSDAYCERRSQIKLIKRIIKVVDKGLG